MTAANALGVDTDSMEVEVTIGVPDPDSVNKDEVLAILPHGTGTLKVVEGGLRIANESGSDASLIAHAAAVVYLDVPEKHLS